MKTIILILMTSICFINQSFAQFKKGTILIGAGYSHSSLILKDKINYNMNNTSLDFKIEFIRDSTWSLGWGFGLEESKYINAIIHDSSNFNRLYEGVWYKRIKKLNNNFYLTSELGLNFFMNSAHYTDNQNKLNYDYSGFGLGFTPTLIYKITNRWLIEGSFRNVFDVNIENRWEMYSQYPESGMNYRLKNINLNKPNLSNFRIGLLYNFRKQ